MKNKTSTLVAVILFATVSAEAQTASNPPYVLEQTVIASGGGQNSAGGAFALDGTVGQPAAGTRSAAAPFAVAGGFWTADPPAPTAATVTVGGRVFTPGGRGLRNARVTLTDARGNSQTVLTTAFGYYRLAEIESGQTVVVAVSSKRYEFQPQVVTIVEELTDLNFVAASSKNAVEQF